MFIKIRILFSMFFLNEENKILFILINIFFFSFFSSETKTDTQSISHIWFVNSLVLQSFLLNDLTLVLTFQHFLMILRKESII